MQKLTQTGQNIVNDCANRYGLSTDAVIHMLNAVNNGSGSMAQFNCPELGGGGQWMAGGMTMVGDMFNSSLKNTVDNLCSELSNALANNQIYAPVKNKLGGFSVNWWPDELGQPFSSGGQNNSRYALFANRLAVEHNGALTIYDTLNHNIGGVSQQQGSNDSLVFNSQFGTLSVSSLPIVKNNGVQPSQPINNNFIEPEAFQQPAPQSSASQPSASQPSAPVYEQAAQKQQLQPAQFENKSTSLEDPFSLIEKLAKLRDMGAVSEEEFQNKKNEFLSRI
ncbi:SHOCT domain-containing protein [Marinicellulosiphila megalodicopiae]|uniref:SHOCT domain-containing protein n=1 Tax=Marinicellulosiphila megalodicopiae TaxID=2724896 RepID=UPI003BAE870F